MSGKRTHDDGNNADLQLNIDRRKEFIKLKTTNEFKKWKRRQMNIQMGLCAWCEKQLSPSFKSVHIDHVMPLYYGGTNNYNNLVLAHKKCNLKKWVIPESVPMWIQNRKSKYARIKQLKAMRKKQNKQIRELNRDIDLENQYNEMRHIMWSIGGLMGKIRRLGVDDRD